MAILAFMAVTIWYRGLVAYSILVVIIFLQLLVLENQITNKATVPIGLLILVLSLMGWAKVLLILYEQKISWKHFASICGEKPHFFIIGWTIIAVMQLYIIYYDIYVVV